MTDIKNMKDLRNMKILGRTAWEEGGDALNLYWTASGIELMVKGSELWVDIEAEYRTYEPWVDILINDALTQRFMVTAGRHRICVFRGMNPEIVKKVQILRDTQAMTGDTLLKIRGVFTDGMFMRPADYELKIEFIGDSITSGEGCTGALCEQDWLPSWMNAVANYSYMTAQKLQAEYRCISQCGWGFYWSWDGHKECNIPRIYEEICGIYGNQKAWDFSSWQPDVVVINLGTNDGSPLGFTADSSLTMDVDKAQELPSMKQAGVAFLKQLRRCNPAAEFLWVYGMLGTQLEPTLLEIIDTYQQQTGDNKIHYLQLQDTEVTGVGARSHPGLECHRAAAKAIAGKIANILKK
ncbi:MAG: GDSL family lipase [Clostridiales bacterium]|nr:GDSL family lipase [Candidatus Blautia equi]